MAREADIEKAAALGRVVRIFAKHLPQERKKFLNTRTRC
jgi:hypothetical protein